MSTSMIILTTLALIIGVLAIYFIFGHEKRKPWPGKNSNDIPTPDKWEGFLGGFKSTEFTSYSQLTGFLNDHEQEIGSYEKNPSFKSQFQTELTKKKNKLAGKS